MVLDRPAIVALLWLALGPPLAHADGKEDGVFNIRDFSAIGDGATDNTQAIQKAIDVASKQGGIVLVPVGRWLCRGHLELKMGVHLKGMNEAPQSWEPQTGSILEPTEGRGNEDRAAFIEMRSSTSVSGLTIYYPEQSVDDIRPYPWTIYMRSDQFEAALSEWTAVKSILARPTSLKGVRRVNENTWPVAHMCSEYSPH